MNISELSNYCVLKAFTDNRRSIIDSLMPFVEYGLSKSDTRFTNIPDLQEFIEVECSIKIPVNTLRSLLRKLKGQNAVKVFGNQESIEILGIDDEGANEFIIKLADANRSTTKFIQECIKFCEFNYTEEEMTSTLQAFIKDYQQYIDMSNGEVRIGDLLHTETNGKIVEFIIYTANSDNENYHTIKNIFNGFILSQFILSKAPTLENDDNRINLIVYIDSNYLLRILDLQPPFYVAASKELLRMLQENNITIKILNENVDEARKVIARSERHYSNGKEFLKAQYGEHPSKIDDVIGAFFRKEMQMTEILELIDRLDDTIKNMGISIEIGGISKYLSIDETVYNAIVRNKLQQKDYEPEYIVQNQYTDQVVAQIKTNALLDAKTISFIQKKRGNRSIYGFDKCKTIFLTCDNALYNANNYLHKKQGSISEVINEESLTNVLYLNNPTLSNDFSIKQLSALYQSSSYISYEILKKFHKDLLEKASGEPAGSSLLNNIFSNESLFQDIVEAQDDTDSLLTELIEKAKKNDKKSQEQMQEKDTQISEQDERIESLSKLVESVSAENESAKKRIQNLYDDKINTVVNQRIWRYKALSAIIIIIGVGLMVLSLLCFFTQIFPTDISEYLKFILGIVGLAPLCFGIIRICPKQLAKAKDEFVNIARTSIEKQLEEE